jgi:hypothetical protein
MDSWLAGSGLDRRFVNLATLMTVLVWPWVIVSTFGLGLMAWQFVLLCQAIALPFAFAGWAVGFRQTARLGWSLPARAMIAGWAALLIAEAGLALVLWPWFGQAAWGPGLWAFPALAVLLTVGVLWLYRADTWTKTGERMRS